MKSGNEDDNDFIYVMETVRVLLESCAWFQFFNQMNTVYKSTFQRNIGFQSMTNVTENEIYHVVCKLIQGF